MKRLSTSRLTARVALGIVVVFGATLVLPRSASRLVAPDALAQYPQTPLPTIPNPLETPTPDPSPTKTEDPDPEPSPSEDPDKDPDDRDGKDGRDGKGKKDGKGGLLDRKKKKGKKDGIPGFVGTYRPSGKAWSTDELVSVAARLRALGWSAADVVTTVYAPFIIGGTAAWTDTWGAPRYGPGPIVRTHEGQDVFCEFGDPVLASESGTIEFDEGGLGGRVARLYRSDGSYWYYAHLSDWNLEQFTTGSTVQPGDVIGYCGNTGNALTTPPHVHFGWYQPSGKARDPQRMLVRWLRAAEDDALDLILRVTAKRAKQAPLHRTRRLFGDAFAPDRSELRLAGESLWGAGTNPSSGTFVLAQAALQAALARTGFAPDRAVALQPQRTGTLLQFLGDGASEESSD